MINSVKLILAKLASKIKFFNDNLKQKSCQRIVLADASEKELSILSSIAPFTMTSPERQLSLCRTIEYVITHSIPGDFVECGVWKGGSAMIAGFFFNHYNEQRSIWLYDNFTGMPPSDDHKDIDFMDHLASAQIKDHNEKHEQGWCQASFEEVVCNMQETGYPLSNINIVQGDVLSSIPGSKLPDRISVLRLDTDWYASTLHELIHLYPLVTPGGFVVIDDYGHWQGARKAVDEYLAQLRPPPFLHRVDYTCRIFQKPY